MTSGYPFNTSESVAEFSVVLNLLLKFLWVLTKWWKELLVENSDIRSVVLDGYPWYKSTGRNETLWQIHQKCQKKRKDCWTALLRETVIIQPNSFSWQSNFQWFDLRECGTIICWLPVLSCFTTSPELVCPSKPAILTNFMWGVIPHPWYSPDLMPDDYPFLQVVETFERPMFLEPRWSRRRGETPAD